MAASRRRGQPVSYREGSPDDDDEEIDGSFSASDSEPEAPVSQKSSARRRARPSPSATRTRRQPRKTYKEEDSDDDDHEKDDDFSDTDDAGSDRPSRRITRPVTKKTRGRPPKTTAAASSSNRMAPVRRQQNAPTPPRPRRAPIPPPKSKGPSQADLWFLGPACPWTTLPFEILRSILTYASFPLFDEKGISTDNVSWLLRVRKLHPALHEAAMAALYFCPPVSNAVKAHGFLSLMASQDDRTMNYNAKVKHLELEARSTLSYSAGADLGSVNLPAVVKKLPLLLGIDIWSIYDDPEFRHHVAARTSRSWTYPAGLFEALADGPQKLRHFHWNTRFLSNQVDDPSSMYKWMRQVHMYSPFQSLQYLKLTSFLGDSDERLDLQFPIGFERPNRPLTPAQQQKEAERLERKATLREQDGLLADALNSLPNLHKLDLHRCSVVDGDWLQLLPKTLTHLGIIECERITSEDFEEYLGSHGSLLQVLALNHNPSLSLSFLTGLRDYCPKLEELIMDLTYIKKSAASKISVDYEHLLLPDERPTWPTTLRTIALNHLHKWSAAAAEVFFLSLVDSATELPDLKELELSVSLPDASWRDRARIRDQWEDRLNRVFLRKPTQPNPHWWSLKACKEWKQTGVATSPQQALLKGKEEPVPKKEATATEGETSEAPSTSTNPRKRKAAAEAPTRRLRPRKSMTSDDEEAGSSSMGFLRGSLRDMVMQTLENRIQGMCDTVEVRIDNQRPSDQQFTEEDFLDAELSGDDDWDEKKGDPDMDEVIAALQKKRSKQRYGRL